MLPHLKRLATNLLTFTLVLILTFLLLHLVPGGPFDQERVLAPEIEQNLYAKYGLHKQNNDSFIVWFAKDLKSYASYLLEGNLGPSLKYRGQDVGDIILKAFGPSFELGAYALLLSLSCSMVFSILVMLKPQGFLDRLFNIFMPLLVSLPSFVLAVFLILIFSFTIPLLPPALWEDARFRILPVLSLSAFPLAYFYQLLRQGFWHEMKQDYIRTARSKGLSENQILIKHALKNAATPLLTVMGPTTAYLITGSFIVETLFAIPGLGRHFVTAVIDRDYFLVMGITALYAGVLILANWLVDTGYRKLDPRIQEAL